MIDMGNYTVKCEVGQYDGYKEIYVYLADKFCTCCQDIAVITAAMPDDMGFPKDTVRVNVYGNPYDEDWTNSFDIPVNMEYFAEG